MKTGLLTTLSTAVCLGLLSPVATVAQDTSDLLEALVEESIQQEALSDRGVALTSTDGQLSLRGTLVSFDGSNYVLDHPALGRLIVPSGVDIVCEGAACPQVNTAQAREITIFASQSEIDDLLRPLLAQYAGFLNVRLEEERTSDGQARLRVVGSNDEQQGELILAATDTPEAVLGQVFAAQNTFALLPYRLNEQDIEDLGISDPRGTILEIELARDAVAMIGHPSNPVRSLTEQEIAQIYSGQIINWSEVGGPDLPIEVFGFAEGDVRQTKLEQAILATFQTNASSRMSRQPSTASMLTDILRRESAIGFAALSDIGDANVSRFDIEEPCGLLSAPTPFRIKNNGYPASFDFHMYGATQSFSGFFNWLNSENGQATLADLGLLNGQVERMKLQDMGVMLIHNAAVEDEFNPTQYVQMMRSLRDAERLSLSFRFELGSSDLDFISSRAVIALAAEIAQGKYDGREIVLIGFADSTGGIDINTELAQSRALRVEQQLRDALTGAETNTRITAESYGELMPLSCNETEVGRERNRRVEVWLR